MAKWDTKTHDFPGSSLDGAFWLGSYGTVGVSGNRVSFAVTGSNYAGILHYSEDLHDSSIIMKVEPSANGLAGATIYTGGGATVRLHMAKTDDPGGKLEFSWNGGSLTQITYDATNHLWWRIRESGGTVYADTAPDGSTWTNRYSVSRGAVSLSSCDLELGSYPYNGSGGTNYFSKLNLPPAGGTTLTHTSPTATATVAGASAPTALSITHTSPTAVATVAGDTAQGASAVTLTHTSPTADATVAGASAPGALSIPHSSPSVVATVAGDTAVGALALAHSSPTADATVASTTSNISPVSVTHTSPAATVVVAGDTGVGDLAIVHTSPAGAATVAGWTVPDALAVSHTSPAASAAVEALTGPAALAVTHTSPTAVATVSGPTASGGVAVAHTSPTVTVTITAGVSQGVLVVSLQSLGSVARSWQIEEPMRALAGLGPRGSYQAEEPFLVT